MKFLLNLSIRGCQEISSAVFDLVSVAPKSLCLYCHGGKKSQHSTSHASFPGAGSWLDPRVVRSCCQNASSCLAGFISSSAETIQNLGIWSEQVGFVLSGQRRPSLEDKLSHLSTYMKCLACIIHSPPPSIQQNLQLRPRLYTSF